jgi:NTP pyrophosphatase (non-canonical NTP hydrolase)
MPDNTTTLATLKEAVRHFAAERAWEPFHTPKNLSMGVAVEAAELMEQFLWVEGEASRAIADDPARLAAVAEEMADVACHLLNLTNTLGIDLSAAILGKIAKNALKYPVEEYRGRSGMELRTARQDQPAASAKRKRTKRRPGTPGQRKGEK